MRGPYRAAFSCAANEITALIWRNTQLGKIFLILPNIRFSWTLPASDHTIGLVLRAMIPSLLDDSQMCADWCHEDFRTPYGLNAVIDRDFDNRRARITAAVSNAEAAGCRHATQFVQ